MNEAAQTIVGENSATNLVSPELGSRTYGKYTIEVGIPLPAEPNHKRSKYPFSEMRAGESVLIPCVKLATLRCALASWRKRNGIDLEMRAQEDGFRVWRKA